LKESLQKLAKGDPSYPEGHDEKELGRLPEKPLKVLKT
jgi:hypothetical protein